VEGDGCETEGPTVEHCLYSAYANLNPGLARHRLVLQWARRNPWPAECAHGVKICCFCT